MWNQQQRLLLQSSPLTLIHLSPPPPPSPLWSPKNTGPGMIIKHALPKTKSCTGLFTWSSHYFLTVFIQLNFSSLLSAAPISSETTHLARLEERALPVTATVMKTLKIAKIDNIFFSQSQQYTLEEGSPKKFDWLTDLQLIPWHVWKLLNRSCQICLHPKSNAEV